MATINVTLRLVKKYFESNPDWTTWEQMQVNRVEFHITNTEGTMLTKVDAVNSGSTSDFITASTALEQNTQYRVKAVAFSPFHISGIQSEEVQFNTGDAVAYHNFESTIIERDTMQPILGAKVTLTGTGVNTETTSRHDGLVWIQRIPAGLYNITVTKAEYTTLTTTWTAGSIPIPFIQLSLSPTAPTVEPTPPIIP